jgi:hypothetical protein
VRIELTHKGFADLSLTTWVPRLERAMSDEARVAIDPFVLVNSHSSLFTENYGAGNGIRTRDFDLGKVALYH